MIWQESVTHILKQVGVILQRNGIDTIEKTVESILKANKIFIYGVGRSGHVGKSFAMRLVQLGLKAYFIGETVTPIVEEGDMALIISNTGSTMSALQSANIVRRVGADVVVMTSKKDSKLAHAASIILEINTTPLASNTELAPLGTIFEASAMIYLDGVVSVLMKHLSETNETMRRRHAISV